MTGEHVVIVPVRNGGQRWQEAANALAQYVRPAARVVVIDSESTDGSDLVAEGLGFTLERIPARSFNHGGTRQAAVQRHAGEATFVVLMTHDAVLEGPDSIPALLASFDDPAIACAFGRQLPHPDADLYATHFCAFNYPDTSSVRSLADADRLGIKAAYFSNSFAAYRRSDLLALGGFPGHLILGEDAWVAMRALLAGRRIRYAAEARVRHSHNYRWSEDARRYFDFGVMHAQIPDLVARLGEPEGEGVRFVRSEWRHVRSRRPTSLPALVMREGTKYLAYRLGRVHRILPLALKRRLSMTRGYWPGRGG